MYCPTRNGLRFQINSKVLATMMDPKMTMQVPEQVRELAEKTIEQAEKGFDAFIDAAKKSAGMTPGPATDMSKKALSITDQNMKASFEHARKLIHAKDMQEAVQLQTEFLKTQFAAAGEQMKQLGGFANTAAKDV